MNSSTRIRPTRVGAVAAALTALGALTLTACGSGGTTTAASCEAGGDAAPDTPTVVILAASGLDTDAHAEDIDLTLTHAADRHARTIVSGVGDDATRTLLANTVLVGTGANELLQERSLACRTQQMRDAVDELAAQPPVDDPDVVASLARTASALGEVDVTETVEVLLLSPMLSRSGGVDLSRPDSLEDPVAAVNRLARAGLIPSCDGWRVHAVTGDSPSSDDPRLREFWRLLVTKCGGELTAWAPHLAEFPAHGAVHAADVSTLTVEESPEQVVATVDGDVLFAPDDATLRPQAAAQLRQVVMLASRRSGPIRVVGHTDVTGTPGPSHRLGLARARAVRAWLTANGVLASRIEAISRGGETPVYADPTTPAQHRANRRVEIVIR